MCPGSGGCTAPGCRWPPAPRYSPAHRAPSPRRGPALLCGTLARGRADLKEKYKFLSKLAKDALFKNNSQAVCRNFRQSPF